MERIVVVGSANTDMIVQSDHLPQPGETVLGGQFMIAAGGKGANQAVAAARLGAQVTFVARLGTDSLGDQALAGYEAEGIDCTFIARDTQLPSGVALIFVDGAGENMIAVASGANSALAPTDVARAEATLRAADVVVAQLEIPLETVAVALDLARRHGVQIILNPAPAQPLPDTMLRGAILTPNEVEVARLVGIEDIPDQPEEAARPLLARGARAVVVTLGKAGVLVVTHERVERVPGFAVQAVDTTAAGDAFNGGLAVALSRGESLAAAVGYASAAAALSVTRLGAQPSLPTQAEVAAFLARQ
jgi:ribokinase